MSYDVFISYSEQDKAVAEAVCTTLESSDIRCWIAPRDILPGSEWAESIIDAIDGSSVFVLVLSSASNKSPQVIRELGRATSKDIPIVPLRIDDVPPSKAIEYFVGDHQWLDAQTAPLEKHLNRLTATVQQLLARERVPPEVIEIAETEEVRKAREAEERAKREAEERARQEAEKITVKKPPEEVAVKPRRLRRSGIALIASGTAFAVIMILVILPTLKNGPSPPPVPKPAPPVLITPTDGTTVPDLTPRLEWKLPSAPGATSYYLQVATDATFATVVIVEKWITDPYYGVTGGLWWETSYYWRVNASNDSGTSDWSEPWTFTTPAPVPISMPSPPILTMPTDGTTVPDLTPRLEWLESTGATSYDLRVATNATFTALVIDEKGITDLYYDVTGGLSWDTSYYWRVNSSNGSGTSDWSEPWTFTTPAPTPPPDESVTFADTNLEAAIREAIHKPEGSIYMSDLESLTFLKASLRGIQNLAGLEYCVYLRELLLSDNQISDLSPLASLTNLTDLELIRNQISDVSPLASLTNLTYLHLMNNEISDVSPLASLTNLTELFLVENEISDISPLASLTNLTFLNLVGNGIRDISPLVENSGLGSGDKISLKFNNLDLSEGSEDMDNIRALEVRGVIVSY